MKYLNDSSIIVCGIVRNAENGLRTNIPVINALCHCCKDFRLVIYENDSTDDTKNILSSWAKTDIKRIHVLLKNTDGTKTIPSSYEVKGNPFFSYKRIEKMANLRNQYMEYVNKQGWNADYLIIVDLDVAKLNLENILTSFTSGKNWDAVTAFGHSLSPKLKRRYHDTFALTEFGDENNPQTEAKIKTLADKYGKMKPSDEWIRVFSAFGGLAIYRFEAIKGLRYKVITNKDERVEVHCEHFSIYSQMAERGFNRVYINPAMSLTYQKLNLKIIMNSIQRMLTKLRIMGGVKMNIFILYLLLNLTLGMPHEAFPTNNSINNAHASSCTWCGNGWEIYS